MNSTSNKRRKITIWMFPFLVCTTIFLYLYFTNIDFPGNYSSSSSIILCLGVVLVAILVVVAIRATMVAGITVLVLLSFVGKRRKILVQEGQKITADVAGYLVKIVFKEKGLIAFACAILSLAAILHI
ncbi:hypothetical protein RJ641_014319 [Dillenia turbinata]|uniref:Uncharacterized protein n=1 Tax=Dillenia turbinata TaxID=194707 RepID=A0AAN8Z149_9MAGN